MEQTEKNIPEQQERSSFFEAYRQTLAAVLRHPATWLLTLLWLATAAYLFSIGRATIPNALLVLSPLILVLLTLPLTHGAPPAPWEAPIASSRSQLWMQSGFTLLCLLLVSTLSFASNIHSALPWLTAYAAFSHNNTLFRSGIALVLEAALPLGFVLQRGVRWRELGFQRGYHLWQVTLLWSALPAIPLLLAIIGGRVTLLTALLRIGIAFLLGALPEEIGVRGVLLTRLMRLLGTGWGIAVTSLLFGLLHFGLDVAQAGSTAVLPILALALYAQMSGGIFFAIVFQRTRSLFPAMVSHALSDALALSSLF